MSKLQGQKLQAELIKVMIDLGITDWYGSVEWASEEELEQDFGEEAYAGVHRQIYAKNFVVMLNEESKEVDDNLTHYIAHECLHVVLHDYRRIADLMLELMPTRLKSTFIELLTTVEERAVDQLAKSYVRLKEKSDGEKAK